MGNGIPTPGQGLVLGRGRKEAGLQMGDSPIEDMGELQVLMGD